MTNQASSYPFQATFVKTFHRGLLSGIRIEETLPLVSYIDPAVFAEQFNKHDLDYKVSDVTVKAVNCTKEELADAATQALIAANQAKTADEYHGSYDEYETLRDEGFFRFGQTVFHNALEAAGEKAEAAA